MTEERISINARPECIMIKLPNGIFDVPEEYRDKKVQFAIYQSKEGAYGAVMLDEDCDPIMETVFESQTN